jgi:hypothetical protein
MENTSGDIFVMQLNAPPETEIQNDWIRFIKNPHSEWNSEGPLIPPKHVHNFFKFFASKRELTLVPYPVLPEQNEKFFLNASLKRKIRSSLKLPDVTDIKAIRVQADHKTSQVPMDQSSAGQENGDLVSRAEGETEGSRDTASPIEEQDFSLRIPLLLDMTYLDILQRIAALLGIPEPKRLRLYPLIDQRPMSSFVKGAQDALNSQLTLLQMFNLMHRQNNHVAVQVLPFDLEIIDKWR